MDISNISPTQLAQQSAQTAQAQDKLSEDFTGFLTLLTTQLQNQDPLDPVESTEFTNQLVAFSGVEQQINMNEKLDQMVSMQLANQSTLGLSFVGLDAYYVGSEIAFNGDPISITYNLSENAVQGDMKILDEDGQIVKTLDDVNLAAGNHETAWDGTDNFGNPVPAGNYEVVIGALGSNDQAIQTSSVVSGRVTGIETTDGVVELLIGNNLKVPISFVLSAREPEA